RPVTETLQKPAATVTMSTQTPPATTTTATAKPAATATTAPPSPAPTQTNSTQSGGTNGGTQGGQDGSRQPISFEIKSGETASTVANNLYKAGIISSADGFLRAVAARNLTGEIMTGTYSLVPGTDYDTLINTICYIRGSS
ncbi:MAG: endolytic transglycosylase MltG, partial [Oscillospiraceae bacterium]|nr:endolytic transglycosylase MltG [Oscillospiraceae bacterium]